jgi:DNA-binding transcriptional ArsR family regulator
MTSDDDAPSAAHQSRGERLRARIERITTVNAFAARFGESRSTLNKLLRDDPSTTERSWAKWEQRIALLEHGESGDAPEAFVSTEHGLIEVELDGVFGAQRVIMRSSADKSPDEVAEYVGRVLDKLRSFGPKGVEGRD